MIGKNRNVMKLTEFRFNFVTNYSVLKEIFEFSKLVVENFVHFTQFSGRVHVSKPCYTRYHNKCTIDPFIFKTSETN